MHGEIAEVLLFQKRYSFFIGNPLFDIVINVFLSLTAMEIR
jgi:hypothetical protein